VLVLTAGCGGKDSSSSDTVRLDPALAEQLAARSEQVALAIEANDGCAASERAQELQDALAAAGGRVPAPVRNEVERILDRRFVCLARVPPPIVLPPPRTVEDDAEDDDHGHHGKRKGKGKDKGKGKKRGHHKEDE
jgi:hypothetical protein